MYTNTHTYCTLSLFAQSRLINDYFVEDERAIKFKSKDTRGVFAI